MKSTRVNDVMNKLHLAVPVKRDNKVIIYIFMNKNYSLNFFE